MDFGDLGRRCTRYKRVMTASGPAKRCASFSDGMGDDLMDDFGDPARDHIAGPLIGGGATQAGILATKLIWKDKPIAKWGGAIGTGLGALVSGILAFRPATRATGISGLITAALIGIPRQIEDLLAEPAAGPQKGYLGVITPEREMYGAEDQMADEMEGARQEVELLDSGSGSTGVLGVITPEREMAGANPGDVELLGQRDVELLGGNGFGSNFLAAQ